MLSGRLSMVLALSLTVATAGVSLVRAEDAPATTPPATSQPATGAAGTWTWTQPGRNGGAETKMSLKLKQEGEKLTGTISGFNNTESEIKEGKIKDDAITFNVVRSRNNVDVTTKYTLKLDGDNLKGKADTDNNGTVRSRDFAAKREGAATKPA